MKKLWQKIKEIVDLLFLLLVLLPLVWLFCKLIGDGGIFEKKSIPKTVSSKPVGVEENQANP